jgi:hypothetical protein
MYLYIGQPPKMNSKRERNLSNKKCSYCNCSVQTGKICNSCNATYRHCGHCNRGLPPNKTGLCGYCEEEEEEDYQSRITQKPMQSETAPTSVQWMEEEEDYEEATELGLFGDEDNEDKNYQSLVREYSMFGGDCE